MRQGNHSNATWALAVAALVVLISGGVVLGSNMGFKFNMPIVPIGGLAPTGSNRVAIPYLTPYTDRECLCQQLGLTPGLANVQELNPATGGIDFYLCGNATCGTAPALTPGRATWIAESSATSAIVVGAHDPSLSVPLVCKSGLLPNGDNWVAVPYRSTSASKQALCDEIGPVVSVAELNPATGGILTYFCDINPANDTPLIKGRAAKVILYSTSAECMGAGSTNWVPNHF